MRSVEAMARPIAIQFDRTGRFRALQQAIGQRALAWPELGQMLSGLRVNAVQDARDHGLIVQEVLA